MTHVAPICRREWRAYFGTSVGWVLLVACALFFALMAWAAASGAHWRAMAVSLAAITDFRPRGALAGARFTVIAGFGRVVAMALAPLIGMRLFVLEKKTRTIEMLFTSPVEHWDIVLGKWLAAWLLYLLLLGVGLAIWVLTLRWHEAEWEAVAASYPMLALIGAALLAVGEWFSALAKNEQSAAAGTLIVGWVLVRVCSPGTPTALGIVSCLVLLGTGWTMAWRAVAKQRAVFV